MRKRENVRLSEIKNIIAMIVLTVIIAVAVLVFYISKDKIQFITYNENSNVDYKVYLKDNDFYKEEYLDKNQGYISNLIKYVSTDFKYNINFSKNVKYIYSYRITAEVDVKDEKNDSSIYHFTEDLVTKKDMISSGNLDFSTNVDINYDEYNNKIRKFKDIYDLNNISSNLNVNLYVDIEKIGDNSSINIPEKKVSSITIPLTERTVSIDINNEVIKDNVNKIVLNKNNSYNWILVISLVFLLFSIIYTVYLIIYSRRTRTAQMIYEKEIKSIMNNYDSYIQRISGTYDIGTSQVLKIESFNDMLEIRDTLKQPILMLENEKKNGTFFIIPATNSIIYTYALRVVDITAKMEGKEIPTYDITEIPHTEFKKNKKYTDEFIKDQIMLTTKLPSIDERNIIRGSKSDEDLYNQLEKTSSFDLNEIRKAKKEAERQEKKANKFKYVKLVDKEEVKKSTKKKDK